ncbi:MAG: hypothetical protein OEY78_00840 [Gammaproteobacteria bacterium]|nr:hypothetical protein [Gammaproteobacteria bacterium]
MKLQCIVDAIGKEDYKKIIKHEIQNLDPSLLPLQQGLSQSSYVSSAPVSVVVLSTFEEADLIHIKTGIFYSGIIAGCNCSDDPSPVDEQNEYCEIKFIINKNTAETRLLLLDS